MSSSETRRLAEGQQEEAGVLSRGVVLQNRYEIIKVLGVGGMGAVYQARDLRFEKVERLCAVKELMNTAPDARLRELAVQNFEREANILATLSHPAIPQIYDYFSEGARSYLVMEFIDGRDLEQILEERGEPIEPERVIDWAIQICDVLAYLHNHEPQPVIFRDIKPSNIMLDRHNRIVLIDFGIAKVFQAGQKGTMIGTEGYSPPEQYRGAAEPRGDLYALGATMHHLLTNRDPRLEPPFSFHERPIRALNPRVPEALEAVVMKALEYDVERRFASAEEMKRALEEVARGSGFAVSGTPTVALEGVEIARSEGDVLAVWEFACEDEVRSSPRVANGVLYIGSYDHNLYALDAEDGSFLWKYPTEGGVVTRPYVWEDLVIFGSEDQVLYALDARTGRIMWSSPTRGRIRSSPTVELAHVFFGSDDYRIYNVSARSGSEVWHHETMGPVRSSPIIVEETVYCGSDDTYIYALNVQDGSLRWKHKTNRPVLSSPFYFEGLILIGSMDWTMYAIDARSGWIVWRYRTNGGIVSSPTVCPSTELVYVGSTDHHLYAFDVGTGRPVWKYKTEGQVNSSPVVADGMVYVGSTDGHLYCIDAKNGELRWKFKTGGAVVSSPIVAGDKVYFGSTDHKVYALLR